ncbi:Putative Protein kinase-like domain [[Torrubiella] hemipterigena]|uniref:Uncharacterized protein n=1 Tax=[Torrubiella] hemipterigena TaxID=1531966 RepID=A0A0A1TLJ2_9HYPO|nr:Putative Protein kinase-like domain [[Torrubiella] hemipterigena]
MAWDLLEKEPLFETYENESQEYNDARQLAAMTVLMGPPPREFLEKSPATRKYWDENFDRAGQSSLRTNVRVSSHHLRRRR